MTSSGYNYLLYASTRGHLYRRANFRDCLYMYKGDKAASLGRGGDLSYLVHNKEVED